MLILSVTIIVAKVYGILTMHQELFSSIYKYICDHFSLSQKFYETGKLQFLERIIHADL
jgi:hypothetical protein